MKILYTILFFADTIFLVFITADFFKMLDKRAGTSVLLFIICGMAVCIFFLGFFLLQYIKQPFARKDD